MYYSVNTSYKKHMNYKKLFEYRTHLMGIAILWVVFFHMQIAIPIRRLEFIKEIGYGGVDIFFLLSGIGVYFSLKKYSIEEFYMRRLKRIMPAYIPIVLIVFLLYNIHHFAGFSLGQILNWIKQLTGNVFMVGWINDVEGQFNWYVQAIMWFYLLAPILVAIVRKSKKIKWITMVLWSVLLMTQVPFMGTFTLMISVRILIYVLGIYIAFRYDTGNVMGMKTALLCGFMIIGLGILCFAYYYRTDWLFDYGLHWFPFVPIVPGLCVLLVKSFSFLDKNRYTGYINKGIKCIGEASFEIYLVHITMFDFILKPFGVVDSGIWIWVAIMSVVVGMCYKKIIFKVTKYLKA